MDLFGRKAQTELSVVKAMLAEKDSYLDGVAVLLAERAQRISDLQRAVNVLGEEVKRLTPPPRPLMSAQPLYMSEDEEDLKFQLDSNLIDMTTYQQMLKELEFENAEVSLAVEDLPESFHY